MSVITERPGYIRQEVHDQMCCTLREKLAEIERLQRELVTARRLRAAHKAVIDSIFAHQEANMQPSDEEKSRLITEMQAAEKAFKSECLPVAPRANLQRYFAPGDLLEVPSDAVLDEFGRYDRNQVVYLASDIESCVQTEPFNPCCTDDTSPDGKWMAAQLIDPINESRRKLGLGEFTGEDFWNMGERNVRLMYYALTDRLPSDQTGYSG